MWPRRQHPNGRCASAKGSDSTARTTPSIAPNSPVLISNPTSLFAPRRRAKTEPNVNLKLNKSAISSTDDAAWMLRHLEKKERKPMAEIQKTKSIGTITTDDVLKKRQQQPRNVRKSGAIGLTMSVRERQQLWRSGAAKTSHDEAIQRTKQQKLELQEKGFDHVFQEVFGKEQKKGDEIEPNSIFNGTIPSFLGPLSEKRVGKEDGTLIKENTSKVTRKRSDPDKKAKPAWGFATTENCALNLEDFNSSEEDSNVDTGDATAIGKAATFERWKAEDAQSVVSTNFVRLNMRKRLKGSTGRAKKRPAYLRAWTENSVDEVTGDNTSTGVAPLVNANGSQQHKQDKSLLADDGVDFIEECLEALAKAEKARTDTDEEQGILQQKPKPLEPPRCHHALVCQILEVKKKNKNYGRRFYACSLSFDEGRCNYFLWEDDHVPLALQTLFMASSTEEAISKAQAIKCVPLDLEASEEEQQDAMLTNLRLVFGHAEFRPGQQWAISRVLRRKDTLLVLPTGAGKSLCHQFPALFLPGLTLVISPLIALMNDQYESLPAPLKARAVCLSGSSDSSVSKAKHAAFVRDLLADKLSLVFLSPEKALGAGMQALLAMPRVRARLALVCVDEAHCISEWSHHFRPSYLRLADVFRYAQCVLCVTATASKRVVHDVLHQLRLRRPSHTTACENKDEMVLQMPWQRRNLALEVQSVHSNDERLRHLLHILPTLSKGVSQGTGGGVIVYVHQQRQTEELAALLREQLPPAWRSTCRVLAFHAGMAPEAKEKVRKGFARGRVRVVVATVAFGMGIDKKNVRAVVHFHMPSSVEAYVQQIGRAGRDGKAARTLLYLLAEDAIHFRSLLFSTALHRDQLRRLLSLVFQKHKPSANVLAVKYSCKRAGEELTLVSLGRDWLEHYLDLKAATIETFLTLLVIETQRDRANKEDDVHVTLQPLSMSRCVVQLLDTQAKTLAPRSCMKHLLEAVRRKELPNARVTFCKDGYLSSWTIDFHVHETAQWYAQVTKSGQRSMVTSDVQQNGETNALALVAATNARQMLQDLRAAQHTGQIQRLTMSQPAFHIQLAGPSERTRDIETETVDRWTALLYAKHEDLELRQQARLAHLYAALHAAALPSPPLLERRERDNALVDKARSLETKLAQYFKNDNGKHDVEDEMLLQKLLRPLSASLIESIERDTRLLLQLRLNGEDLKAENEDESKNDEETKWTSYAVAKVFHGLTTPRLPTRQWRDHVCWRKYADVAFERIVLIVHKVLAEDQL